MKKLISFVGTYVCYYVGHFLSLFMKIRYLDFLYEPYKKLMIWSFQIQDWGNIKGPWKEVENGEVLAEEEKELN